MIAAPARFRAPDAQVRVASTVLRSVRFAPCWSSAYQPAVSLAKPQVDYRHMRQ